MTEIDDTGHHSDERKATGPVHDQKRSKNWTMFAALIGFIALIFAITIYKMS
jgi:hypothetical protein